MKRFSSGHQIAAGTENDCLKKLAQKRVSLSLLLELFHRDLQQDLDAFFCSPIQLWRRPQQCKSLFNGS